MSLNLPEPGRPAPSARRLVQAYRHWQTGQGHARQERWPAAAAAFGQATDLHDASAYGLAAAHALIKCGRAVDALERARHMRLRHPQQILGYTLETHALLSLGQSEEALQCARGLPAGLRPDHPYLTALSMALYRCGRHAEAIPVFLQALALKMDDAYLHFHLGMSFKSQGMKAEAAECVRTAVLLGLGASELSARGQLVFLEREACRWSEAQAELARLRSALLALPAAQAIETSPFTHAVVVGDPMEQLKVSRHYALHAARKVQALPRVRAREREGRLRVGYLSADFHNHATSQLMVQMLEQHDRGRFEIFVLSTGPDDGSALRRRVAAAVEHFVDLRGHPEQVIARRVRELGVDVLVDLKGATQDALLPVFAARPAPLQVAWLGFPGTTGAPYIDYLIGDPVVTPLEHAAHYSEKIAQLPLCYQPNDAHRERPMPSTRAAWGVSEDALLLCAFHQSYKISPEVFDVWCSLLEQRPDAVLWLLQWNTNVQATLRAAAIERGIDPRRLVFAPLLPLQQHLSRLACADIYLDAWPCNAHTTAGEALWVGVPVVTLIGPTFAQRVAASLLHALALDELVCQDICSYRAKVLELADDDSRRAALKTHLAQQSRASGLFDGARFARDLESLFQRMWQEALGGRPPQHIAAGSLPAGAQRAAVDVQDHQGNPS
jgi:predicted O-linked N-acetylglucosamine transferase (SPINDLY family)